MNDVLSSENYQYLHSVATSCHMKISVEDRSLWEICDFEQEIHCHVIRRLSKYDKTRDFDPWFKTVVTNKGISLIQSIWSHHHRRYVTTGCLVATRNRTAYDYIEDDKVDGGKDYQLPILIDDLGPELLLMYDEVEFKEMLKIDTDRIEKLCASFEVPFCSDEPKESLLDVLDQALNKLLNEEFDALDEPLRDELSQLGRAAEQNKLKIVPPKGAPKKRSTAMSKVRELFDEGKGLITTPGIIEALNQAEIRYNEISLKNEVRKLRRKYSITNQQSDGTALKTGICAHIKRIFEAGRHTNKEVIGQLKQEGIEYSVSTVRTQLVKLRKKAGIETPSKTTGKAGEKLPTQKKGKKQDAMKVVSEKSTLEGGEYLVSESDSVTSEPSPAPRGELSWKRRISRQACAVNVTGE